MDKGDAMDGFVWIMTEPCKAGDCGDCAGEGADRVGPRGKPTPAFCACDCHAAPAWMEHPHTISERTAEAIVERLESEVRRNA